MKPPFTIGDYLEALTGGAANSVELTLEELNVGDSEPFVAPSATAIYSLKQQISFEAWLYLMGADSLGVKYNHRRGAREAQQHLVRSVALLDFKDKTTPLNSPAVRARIRWLQRRVLNLGGDTTPKPYYQLMAEGQMTRARQQAAHTALWDTLSPEQQQNRLQEHWGDLSPEALEQCEQQAKIQQADEESLTVASRKVCDFEIEHPAFARWFVNELLCREPLEIDAYLSLMWRISNADEPAALGDTRRNILPEQVPSLINILKIAVNDVSGKAKHRLKYAKKLLKAQIKVSSATIPDASSSNQANQPTLSHRQIALREFYRGRKIQNDARAQKLAEENNLTSGEVLTKYYRRIAKEGGITDVGEKGLISMIADLELVKDELKKDNEIHKLDIHLRMLRNAYLRTGPD